VSTINLSQIRFNNSLPETPIACYGTMTGRPADLMFYPLPALLQMISGCHQNTA